MRIDFFDREEVIKELDEKLKDEQFLDLLREKGIAEDEFFDGILMIVSFANHWYKKGYQDAQTGGDVD